LTDSNVSISFGADASDFLEGVARVSSALQALPSSVNQSALGAERSSQSFVAFGAGATNALNKVGDAARASGAQQEEASDASLAKMNREILMERATLAQKKSIFDELTKLKVMSGDERLEATRTALDAEYAAERSLLERESQLGQLSVDQRQQILNRMQTLDARYALESQKIVLQSIQQIVAPMDHVVDAMSASFSSGLSGMIMGTRTLNQALVSVAQSVVKQFVRMGVEIVADWGKRQIALAVLSNAGESQKTAAAAMGASARSGIAAGEAAAGQASMLSSVLKSITASASEAFAGVFGFLAPIMGPAAAGPAAAAQDAVMSVGAFDIGAWSIPQDQLAMVHKNELIMPAAEAGAFRSMLTSAASNGGAAPAQSGDTHVHLNVSAMDAGSVKNWLSGNSRQIMQALNKAIQKGDHLGLRRLSTI
jgi:hypothetical protein